MLTYYDHLPFMAAKMYTLHNLYIFWHISYLLAQLGASNESQFIPLKYLSRLFKAIANPANV